EHCRIGQHLLREIRRAALLRLICRGAVGHRRPGEPGILLDLLAAAGAIIPLYRARCLIDSQIAHAHAVLARLHRMPGLGRVLEQLPGLGIEDSEPHATVPAIFGAEEDVAAAHAPEITAPVFALDHDLAVDILALADRTLGPGGD